MSKNINRKGLKQLVITIVLSILFNHISLATTYYVSTTGSDSNNGTTITTPFLTIAKGITKAVAGDIIYVRSGTYAYTTSITISKAGILGSLITLSAYPADITSVYPVDGRPVIDFSGMTLASGNQGFKLSNADYWYIYGLRIKGAGDNGMLVQNTDYTTIEFCDFLENRDAGFQIRSSSAHCTIKNCDSYFNADYIAGSTTSDGGNADGFAPKLDLGDSVVFVGCRAWLNSDDGWDGYLKAFESSLPDLMTTYTLNCWSWRNGYLKDGVTTTSGMNGNGIKMGGSTNKDQAHNWVATNCLSMYNKSKGFDQNNSAGSLTLYNCTSVKNTAQDFALNSSGVTYNASSVFTVKNCVEFGTTGTSFKTGTILATNNFATASTDYVSIDTTGISGHRKVDGSLPDVTFMHPKIGSVLIDKGTNVGLPYNGTLPDLGYWETASTTSITQSLSLAKGWNLISFNVSPTVKIIDTVFKAVISNVTEIKTMDAFWRSGQNIAFNSLKTITDGAAYLVYMKATGTIAVSGTAITASLPTIKTGWQLLGCPYQANTTLSTILSSTNCSEIKNFTGFWIPSGTTNSITTLDPGKGYFVKGK
jgi:hypothetical protein